MRKTAFTYISDSSVIKTDSFGVKSESVAFENWPCHFRMNKYHFTPRSVGSCGVQIHTDSGFMTILHDDDNVDGLEVMDESDHFILVDPWPGTLVKLGDIARVWSNGRFCNVKHRVQCMEATIRISIASFLLGPRGVIKPLPELVDDDHPCVYVPTTYEESRKIIVEECVGEESSSKNAFGQIQDDENVGGLEVTSGHIILVDPWPDNLIVNVSNKATVCRGNSVVRILQTKLFSNKEIPTKYAGATHQLINKYHFTRGSVCLGGVQLHTDTRFLTVLQDDESVGGLQVIDKSDDTILVDPWPDTLVVNLGDMATVWSNVRFCDGNIRVQCIEATIHVSIAFFLLAPRWVIEPLRELVDVIHVPTCEPPLIVHKVEDAGEALKLLERSRFETDASSPSSRDLSKSLRASPTCICGHPQPSELFKGGSHYTNIMLKKDGLMTYHSHIPKVNAKGAGPWVYRNVVTGLVNDLDTTNAFVILENGEESRVCMNLHTSHANTCKGEVILVDSKLGRQVLRPNGFTPYTTLQRVSLRSSQAVHVLLRRI
ncbi:hypothetical protein OSB04_027526 [Centaurea solstitialis]|uniref:Fe2OG dioxygenase domain-containing protein n=1 Tax=Centaurea solstitialis TaxID=347529 RepID=A0AA38SE18_9ASTR|nr:hypothetical protein OSB04_027526 [Centaurea solstitialis]